MTEYIILKITRWEDNNSEYKRLKSQDGKNEEEAIRKAINEDNIDKQSMADFIAIPTTNWKIYQYTKGQIEKIS